MLWRDSTSNFLSGWSETLRKRARGALTCPEGKGIERGHVSKAIQYSWIENLRGRDRSDVLIEEDWVAVWIHHHETCGTGRALVCLDH
jgi:hypothetical protein